MKQVEVKVKDKAGKVLESVSVDQCESLSEAVEKFGEVGLVSLANSAHRAKERNKIAVKYQPVSTEKQIARVIKAKKAGEITAAQAREQIAALTAKLTDEGEAA